MNGVSSLIVAAVTYAALFCGTLHERVNFVTRSTIVTRTPLWPRTTKPGEGHQIYPYLLRGMRIDRPNQVWAMDITYIPMARGFVYLETVVDWATRRVLSWRVSITMTTDFCLEALDEALRLYGRPQIFNTDQGSQGEFNRSSQHWIVEQILETCPVLRRVFSSQVFFGA